ncbi:MAG: hypothetical protein WBC05_08655, partial [Sedimentisphaerales bacterium]
DTFEIVGRAVELYTLFYVEDTVLLYEIFCGLGGFVWGGGVFFAGAVCGFEGLHGLVLCADHVRNRGSATGRGF